MQEYTFDGLDQAVKEAAAIRYRVRLQPAGGPGEKVFPPTYEGGQYAKETRVVDGERRDCVLLDSVQSQANRMELTLLEGWRGREIRLPMVLVDFTGRLDEHIRYPELGELTVLEVPHRLADAILRDSTYNGTPFRETKWGKVLDSASCANATGFFEVCPTALLFGIWDSTGPRGGLGTKFARALVSEVVAVDAQTGVRPSSRIDPLGIEKGAAIVYRKGKNDWTLDPDQADRENAKPVPVGAKKAKEGKKGKDGDVGDKVGRPSTINHGNVTPSLKDEQGRPHHGGVTFAYALQTTVLSLPALRRLRFPTDGGQADERDWAARAVLAALGVYAMRAATARGGFLRSRCHLVPEGPDAAEFAVVCSDGQVAKLEPPAPKEAARVLDEAVKRAREHGLWKSDDPVRLRPRDDLVELVRKSRELKLEQAGEDAGD